MTFEILGVTLHWYGVFVGLAVVTGMQLVEHRLRVVMGERNWQKFESAFWVLAVGVVVSGVLGARLWHVGTDWHLYAQDLSGVFEIWRGGLSILGGVAGGVLGLLLGIWLMRAFRLELLPSSWSFRTTLGLLLDVSVFGLPVAQAIGRLGNAINQELYGLPTSLPWGMPVDPRYRLVGFESYTHFHPLFAYEMAATLLFAVFIWRWYWRSDRPTSVQLEKWFGDLKLGSGRLFLLYVVYYSFVRFMLDFIRPDKAQISNWLLGSNQLVLIIVIAIAVVVLRSGKESNAS